MRKLCLIKSINHSLPSITTLGVNFLVRPIPYLTLTLANHWGGVIVKHSITSNLSHTGTRNCVGTFEFTVEFGPSCRLIEMMIMVTAAGVTFETCMYECFPLSCVALLQCYRFGCDCNGRGQQASCCI